MSIQYFSSTEMTN